jgi:hypothetical protein
MADELDEDHIHESPNSDGRRTTVLVENLAMDVEKGSIGFPF